MQFNNSTSTKNDTNMKTKFRMLLSAITFIAGLALLFAALALPGRLAAQDKQGNNPKHHHYKLIDLGTFGGPTSYFRTVRSRHPEQSGDGRGLGGYVHSRSSPLLLQPRLLRLTRLPMAKRCLDRSGSAWPAGWSSSAFWISGNGIIVGNSENGEIDPLVGFPEFRAVLWQNGGITDLGTLEGGYESVAGRRQQPRPSSWARPEHDSDPSLCLLAPGFCTTQTRAFLWQNGVMQDLGTLGGPDAIAALD